MKANWLVEYLKDLITKKECSGCHRRFRARVLILYRGGRWCPECWMIVSRIRKVQGDRLKKMKDCEKLLGVLVRSVREEK